MPTYAITGASGQLGRLAVQELLARAVPAAVAWPGCVTSGRLENSVGVLHGIRPTMPRDQSIALLI